MYSWTATQISWTFFYVNSWTGTGRRLWEERVSHSPFNLAWNRVLNVRNIWLSHVGKNSLWSSYSFVDLSITLKFHWNARNTIISPVRHYFFACHCLIYFLHAWFMSSTSKSVFSFHYCMTIIWIHFVYMTFRTAFFSVLKEVCDRASWKFSSSKHYNSLVNVFEHPCRFNKNSDHSCTVLRTKVFKKYKKDFPMKQAEIFVQTKWSHSSKGRTTSFRCTADEACVSYGVIVHLREECYNLALRISSLEEGKGVEQCRRFSISRENMSRNEKGRGIIQTPAHIDGNLPWLCKTSPPAGNSKRYQKKIIWVICYWQKKLDCKRTAYRYMGKEARHVRRVKRIVRTPESRTSSFW